MTENVYDDEAFFSAYSQLNRSRHGLDGAPEWPALRAMLPDLGGKSVVDLGCGFGWFSRWAIEAGATNVLGIDGSERMLNRAREMTSSRVVTFRLANLETVELPKAAFDLAFSSLTFHYLSNLGRIFAEIRDGLTPGGTLVFSMEHPIYMAPSNPRFATGQGGRRIWPLEGYSLEGARTTDWLAPGVVKQHRTLGTTLNLLIDAGFTVRRVNEWSPNDALLEERPEFVEERDRPMFLLVSAVKN